MPMYLCKCRKCAFVIEPSENLQLVKDDMLAHLEKSHGFSFEFSHNVPLGDLRESFTIDAVREASEVGGYRMLLALGIRKAYWAAQRLPNINPL